MAGLYTVLTVVRVIAFYGLLWYITGNSFRYLVLKKEHEGKTKHLIKTKTVVISVLLGLCFYVGNIDGELFPRLCGKCSCKVPYEVGHKEGTKKISEVN